MKQLDGALRFLFWSVAAVTLAACATAPPGGITADPAAAQDPRQQLTMDSLTVAAYERVVPRLSELRAGDRITSKIELNLIPILERGKKTDAVVAVSDGWVGALSGGTLGAATGFGGFVGQTGDVLLGEHLFGYLFERGMLVPQYVVAMQATVISADEYKRRKDKAKADGLVFARDKTRLYFRDLSVVGIRKLKFMGPDKLEGGYRIGEPASARSFVTIERFEEAEKKLKSLTPGTDFWDALFALNMSIATFDSGVTFRAWLADGYLGQAWEKLTPGGNFHVLRFGYLQDNNEVPKLALIFKNGRVHKLVPHGTQEELERYFE